MKEKYYTIDGEYSAELTEKKSRFIANIICIDTEEEAEKYISAIEKKNREAKHNIFAYRILREETIIERYSDNGEPSGTAGKPILDILRAGDLCNIIVVVTRFFGGILLGTGGLLRAYSGVFESALKEAKKIQKTLSVKYEVHMDYGSFDKVQHYCLKNNYQIEKTCFKDEVVLEIIIGKDAEEKFIREISDLFDGKADIKLLNKFFYV